MNYFIEYPSIIDDVYKDNLKAKEVLLIHSYNVTKKALDIIDKKKLALDKQFIYEGAMLHDIGIIGTNAPDIFCFGDKPYLWHGIIGAKFLENTKYEKYQSICKNHFGVGLRKDEVIKLGIGSEAMVPNDTNEMLIAYADNFFSKKYVDKLNVELSVEDIIKNLSRFGDDKIEIFYKFHKMFS